MRRHLLTRALPAAFLLAVAGCGKGSAPSGVAAPSASASAPAPSTAAPSTAALAPGTAAPATGATAAAPAPLPTVVPADAAEMRKAISEFTLTDKTLDAIIASEKELGDFWANPEDARKVRGERSLAKILAAIDASPRLKSTLAKHGLSGREYILGTFSMIAGFMWDKAKAQNPQLVQGQTQPVNDATLGVVHKRLADVTKLLSPAPKPKQSPRPHPNDEF